MAITFQYRIIPLPYAYTGATPTTRFVLIPALVYAATVDLNQPGEYELKMIGHSHYSGKDGNLYTDLSTFTTAHQIVEKLVVRVK